MGWEADAGRTLVIKDQAAESVGVVFDALAAKLEEMQQQFQEHGADLGMNGSKEGDTWNGKVNDAHQAVYDRLGEFAREAKRLATAAHTMQKECHQIEDSEAKKFDALDRSAGYPYPVAP